MKRCVYECFCFYLDSTRLGYAVSVAIAVDDAYALIHSLTRFLLSHSMLLLCYYFWVACICSRGSSHSHSLIQSFTLASSSQIFRHKKIDKNLPCTHISLCLVLSQQNTRYSQFFVLYCTFRILCPLLLSLDISLSLIRNVTFAFILFVSKPASVFLSELKIVCVLMVPAGTKHIKILRINGLYA